MPRILAALLHALGSVIGAPLYGVPFMMIDDDTLEQLLRINEQFALKKLNFCESNRNIVSVFAPLVLCLKPELVAQNGPKIK